jgi:uncharacterized protein YbjT (DUF2867 family)
VAEPTGGTVLVTGASGYVGGRLIRRLAESGHRVRGMTRKPSYLRERLPPGVEAVAGDALAQASLGPALAGIDVAYYLIHSMEAGRDFAERDRRAAENFATAARAAGVSRIIYLGGLGPAEELSPHLASRQEVGRILRDAVPTVELRASIVLGSGSLSFEMLRALVEHLPVMVTPRWVAQRAQPIAIEDVLAYLEAALHLPPDGSEVVQIGGPERVTYRELMLEYARQRGLRRILIPVPVLTPWLSSLWLGLVTPLYARVGRALIDSLRNETVVDSDRARTLFPGIRPRPVSEAIERALANEDRELAETRWNDALGYGADDGGGYGGRAYGLRRVDSRTAAVDVPPERAFAVVLGIGGDRGWYYGDWLWRLRGFLDLLVGGVGARRGRRDPDRVVVGEALDFWRVDAVEENRLLRLHAEMKLPGRAWLQFEVQPRDGGGSSIRQTAIFDPVGLPGLLYWYGIYPLHALVFRGMLRGIARAAEAGA